MRKLGYTQREVAGIVGLAERTIRRLEKDSKVVKFEVSEENEIFEDIEEGWLSSYTKELGACTPESKSWNFIVYEDSAPEDWEDQVIRTGCPVLIGVIHNKDSWKRDDPKGRYKAGELKKFHYHCNIKLPQKVSLKKAAMLIQKMTHGPIPKVCEDEYGLVMYVQHRHKDGSPIAGKVLYPAEGIRYYNGWEPERSEMDLKKMRTQLDRYLTSNKVVNFAVAVTLVRCDLGNEYLGLLRKDSHYYRGIIEGNKYLTQNEAGIIASILAQEEAQASASEEHWELQKESEENGNEGFRTDEN